MFLLVGILMGWANRLQAQKQVDSIDCDGIPAWVKMMDDPNVNDYKAVKAFDTNWKNREDPVPWAAFSSYSNS